MFGQEIERKREKGKDPKQIRNVGTHREKRVGSISYYLFSGKYKSHAIGLRKYRMIRIIFFPCLIVECAILYISGMQKTRYIMLIACYEFDKRKLIFL